ALGQPEKAITVSQGKVVLEFRLDGGGKPTYALFYDHKPVIRPSALGFALDKEIWLQGDFTLLSSEQKMVDQIWEPVWGETKQIRNHYTQLEIHLQQAGSAHLLLNLVFRVF